MITLPVRLTLTDWASAITIDLSSQGLVPRMDDESKWQEWAANLFVNLNVTGPNPYKFDNWLDWAERFVETYEIHRV